MFCIVVRFADWNQTIEQSKPAEIKEIDMQKRFFQSVFCCCVVGVYVGIRWLYITFAVKDGKW